MAQPYAKLEVPLGLGLSTDIDDKLLPVGKVSRLENAIVERTGELLKRSGATALGTQYAAGTPGTMPLPWQLANHKGALVSLSKAGPRPIGVYSPALGKWIAPAGVTSVDNVNGVASKLRGQVLPRRTTVFRSNAKGATTSMGQPNMATDGTYALNTWVEATSGANAIIHGQLTEIATGKTIFTYSRTNSTINAAARAVYVNSQFRIVFIDGANMKYVTWTSANIASGFFTASGEFSLATDAGNFWFDLIASGTDMLTIYNSTTTTKITKTDSLGATTVSVLVPQGGGTVADGVHGWVRDLSAAGKVAACCSSASQGVRVHWDINTATGATALSYTIDGAATTAVQIVGFTISSNGTGEFVVLWHTTASPAPVVWGRRVVAGITTSNWIMRAGLASQALIHNGEFYVALVYDSDEQGSYFLVRVPTVSPTDGVDGNRTPSARYCTGQGVSPQQAIPQPIATLSTDVFLTTQDVRVREVQIAGFASVFDTGIDGVSFTFNPANVNSPREFADNLYVCGGILGAFDGTTFSEEGFHLFPEGLTTAQQAGGSLTALGNYIYTAVYRYTDDFGRLRRSSPSDPVTLTLTGANQGAQIGVRTLKLHGHLDASAVDKVVIELYRTPNNNTDEYRLAATAANNAAVDSITFTDTQSDTSLGAGELLYNANPGNTAGEFEAPPPALAIAAYKDRLAVIAADDPTLIWISLPLSEVEGPRFNSESTIRIDDARGDLTGLAAIDDRLIAFKSDAIYAIVGDGPDVDGNGTFGIAQLIASGIGCVEPRSIVQIPDGVMFRSDSSRAGLYAVNRGLAVEYIGKEVQSSLNSTVTIADAVHLSELQRTEFFTNTNTLAYDHVAKLWSVFTGQAALAASIYNQVHAYQRPTGSLSVYVDPNASNSFDDAGVAVEEYVESPWLSIAQLKGYLRFKRIQLVGTTNFVDPGDPGYKVTISLFKDFSSTAFHSEAKNMLTTDDINAIEMRYSTKLSALKVGIRISQRDGDTVNFAGPKLTGFTLVYEVKDGLKKIASGNRTA